MINLDHFKTKTKTKKHGELCVLPDQNFLWFLLVNYLSVISSCQLVS